MAHFAVRLDPEYVDDDGQMAPFALHTGAGAAGLAPGENPAHVVEYWGHADGTEGGPGKPGPIATSVAPVVVPFIGAIAGPSPTFGGMPPNLTLVAADAQLPAFGAWCYVFFPDTDDGFPAGWYRATRIV